MKQIKLAIIYMLIIGGLALITWMSFYYHDRKLGDRAVLCNVTKFIDFKDVCAENTFDQSCTWTCLIEAHVPDWTNTSVFPSPNVSGLLQTRENVLYRLEKGMYSTNCSDYVGYEVCCIATKRKHTYLSALTPSLECPKREEGVKWLVGILIFLGCIFILWGLCLIRYNK